MVPLLIGWSLFAVLLSLWTVYAIYCTWLASMRFPPDQRIFGSAGFATLAAIVGVLVILNAATLPVDRYCRARAGAPK
jgi:uncharacterized membrane protein (UPF0182 family)